jgi:hypothetical protein
VRSSKAISEDGFFVALKGYEAQVFIDIYEIEDDEKGRWARLNHDLGGRGVNDPNTAIMDIYLGDLYYRFTKLLRPEIVNQLHNFFVSGVAEKSQVQSFTESLKEQAVIYFDTVRHCMAGADGKYDKWGVGSGEWGVENGDRGLGNGELWQEFKGYLERLIGLVGYLKPSNTNPQSLIPNPQSLIPSPQSLLQELAENIREKQFVCAAALGYGLLAILRPLIGKGTGGELAYSLAFEHWDFDRKLTEQYRLFGASGGESRQLAEINMAVLRRTAAETETLSAEKFDAGKFAASIIEENYPRDDFRSLLGINVFNDVAWFNKEAFESASFYAKLLLVLENDSAFLPPHKVAPQEPLPWPDRVGRIAEVSCALEKAEKASGYKLGSLIAELGGTPAAESIPKKSVNKKTKKGKKKE